VLLYARNSNVYVVVVKQQGSEGMLPEPKLICSCVLLVTYSCYHSVDGNLHVQGAQFPRLRRHPEQRWSWPKRDNAAGSRLSLECDLLGRSRASSDIFLLMLW
jgi:hypothetical protein